MGRGSPLVTPKVPSVCGVDPSGRIWGTQKGPKGWEWSPKASLFRVIYLSASLLHLEVEGNVPALEHISFLIWCPCFHRESKVWERLLYFLFLIKVNRAVDAIVRHCVRGYPCVVVMLKCLRVTVTLRKSNVSPLGTPATWTSPNKCPREDSKVEPNVEPPPSSLYIYTWISVSRWSCNCPEIWEHQACWDQVIKCVWAGFQSSEEKGVCENILLHRLLLHPAKTLEDGQAKRTVFVSSLRLWQTTECHMPTLIYMPVVAGSGEENLQ